MEVGTRKECVTTHLPNETSPENGWRSSVLPIPHRQRFEVMR